MYTYATLVLLFIIGYVPIDVDCYFASPLNSTYAINNITCANSTIGTGNPTTFLFLPFPIYSFCVILLGISTTGQTIMVQQPIQSPWIDFSWAYDRGGSGSDSNYPKQYGWIRMSRTRCTGFSTSSDIGYGSCTSLSYEPFISSTLCICSTNLCNVNMAACQSSVQSSTNPPPRMPPLISSFSVPISCVDSYSYFAYGFYYFSLYNNYLYNTSLSLFSAYFSSNTVMCMISYDHQTNSTFRTPMTMEEYDAAVNTYWVPYAVDHVYGFSGWQFTSSTGNLLVSYVSSGSPTYSICYCTSSNCNVDLATCTSGLYQSSNVSMSIASTTTIVTANQSQNGTTSRVSTTGSTSFSTSGVITSLPTTTRTSSSTSPRNTRMIRKHRSLPLCIMSILFMHITSY